MSKIEIPKNKKTFVINSEHADMIVNDLLQGDYETLGRIFTDLVNYNLTGDEQIIEITCEDKAERTARRLFKSDSEHYITHYTDRSKQNAKNRTAGQYPDDLEIKDYARAKNYDEQIVLDWCIKQAHNNWKDQNGEPIRYWKKTLDKYMQGVNRKKIEQMAGKIGK